MAEEYCFFVLENNTWTLIQVKFPANICQTSLNPDAVTPTPLPGRKFLPDKFPTLKENQSPVNLPCKITGHCPTLPRRIGNRRTSFKPGGHLRKSQNITSNSFSKLGLIRYCDLFHLCDWYIWNLYRPEFFFLKIKLFISLVLYPELNLGHFLTTFFPTCYTKIFLWKLTLRLNLSQKLLLSLWNIDCCFKRKIQTKYCLWVTSFSTRNFFLFHSR